MATPTSETAETNSADLSPLLTSLPLPGEDWHRRAACYGMDTNFFYIEKGHLKDLQAAQAVCRACPVKRDCLATALRNGEEHGMWGGYTARQRKKLIRSLESRAA